MILNILKSRDILRREKHVKNFVTQELTCLEFLRLQTNKISTITYVLL